MSVKEEIEKKMQKLYEDDEVVVEYNLSYQEIKQLVLDLLRKYGPLKSYKLNQLISPIASDDTIRRILRELESEGKVIYDQHIKKYRVIE